MENTAVCRFCGQTYHSDANTEEGLIRSAIMQCDCGNAVALRKKWERIDTAKFELNEVLKFNPMKSDEEVYGSEEFAEIIKDKLGGFIEHLIDFEVSSVTVKISGIGKISMQVTGDGNIKIKKQVTQSYESKV